MAPQAMLMNSMGNMGLFSGSSDLLESPSVISGISGNEMNSMKRMPIAMKMRATAKAG